MKEFSRRMFPFLPNLEGKEILIVESFSTQQAFESPLTFNKAVMDGKTELDVFTATGLTKYLTDNDIHAAIIHPSNSVLDTPQIIEAHKHGFPILVLKRILTDDDAAMYALLAEQGIPIVDKDYIPEKTNEYIDCVVRTLSQILGNDQ